MDGAAALERWMERTKVEEWGPVQEALIAVQDDTWREKYHHLDEVTAPRAVVLYVTPDLVIVWRPIIEYPDYYRVIYVGHPDDYEF